MFDISTSGSFSKTEESLAKLKRNQDTMAILHKGGLSGVLALRMATPVNSGLASNSWGYEISKRGSIYILTFTNSDVENGFPVALMIQYGYGTGNGGFVAGVDYINPALKPIFDEISDELWKAVTSA
jgi:hypothetical protein